MTPQQVKNALAKNKVSQAQIAQELLVSRAAIARVITRATKSERIQQRIADIIGKPFAKVWTKPKANHHP